MYNSTDIAKCYKEARQGDSVGRREVTISYMVVFNKVTFEQRPK